MSGVFYSRYPVLLLDIFHSALISRRLYYRFLFVINPRLFGAYLTFTSSMEPQHGWHSAIQFRIITQSLTINDGYADDTKATH